MMKMLRDYLRLILFSMGMLVGVQLPAMVDQYAKRVDAMLSEARQNLVGFQQTADRFFAGDIQKLLNHYKASDDAVFKQDAGNIEYIVTRVALLKDEMMMLQQGQIQRTFHVVFAHDQTIMQQTMAQYTYVLILQPSALLWGLAIALLLSLLIEALLSALVGVQRQFKRPKQV
ncbi:DUF2937 family protein [Flavobacterium sp. W21_SRS_FM6]|uniref:DUF2937 family protein n=1 Tax=Flavobacterium sp. W21_SRS_FM6 TaxID=3240268 RepID=UPI003F927020